MHRRRDADRTADPVRRHPRAVPGAGRADPQQPGDTANAGDVGLHDVERLAFDQALACFRRELVLAAGDRDG